MDLEKRNNETNSETNNETNNITNNIANSETNNETSKAAQDVEAEVQTAKTEEKDEKNRLVSEPDMEGKRYFDSNMIRPAGEKRKLFGINRGLMIFIIIILAILALVGVGTSGCSNNNFGIGTSSKPAETELPDDEYIAEIYVEGTIQSSNTGYFGEPVGYQHRWTLDIIDELMYDDNNVGLLIYVDTPGGGVYESDELYLKIKEYQETEKPVYVYMSNMAASGGYYISAPADKIMANRNCWTGSIGVTIGTMMDFSGLLERYGVETVTIDSGTYKSMGSSYRKMSQGEKDIWQSLVDEAYLQFVGIVAEGRGLSLEETIKIADGRIYSAQQALEVGLIDEIMTYDAAIYTIQEECGTETMAYLYPETSYNILSFLSLMADKIQKSAGGELGALNDLIEKNAKMPTLKYMYE